MLILFLVFIFQLKHLIADYYLQVPYMYLNKGKESNWVLPLASHAGVHALFTLAIAIWFGYVAIFAAVLDFVTHFIIDRWKARQTLTPQESKFWVNLGIDQFLHHIVAIVIIFMILI